ncbi:MAG: hypothetical protein M0P69_16620 [Bacteroidales bacterium]|nr:hypothetical protein [Bacteroidales bacterium]
MTEYMPILPIWGFDIFEQANVDHCFILPALWENDKYQDFYTSRRWKTVIIDNDMYETPEKCADIDSLIDIADSLNSNSTFIVGPEDMQNGLNTPSMISNLLTEYDVRGDSWDLMTVLHGKPHEIVEQHKELKQLGISAFGIAVSSWRLGFDRGSILSLLRPYSGGYYHAMGLDSLCEVINLKKWGFNSVDSSIAATCAVNNINMFEQWNVVRVGLPTDPIRVDLKSIKTDNLTFVKTYINVLALRQYVNNPVWYYHEYAKAQLGTALRVGRQLVDEVP